MNDQIAKLVISGAGGCDYCVAAHNHLAKLAGVRPEVLKQIREGQPTGDAKRDALVGFVRKLAQSSGTVSDEDFAAIKAAGYSDAQLVEISLAFATTVFTNVFNRINDTTMAQDQPCPMQHVSSLPPRRAGLSRSAARTASSRRPRCALC